MVFHLKNILGILPLQDSILMIIIDDIPWMFECQYSYNLYDGFSHTEFTLLHMFIIWELVLTQA